MDRVIFSERLKALKLAQNTTSAAIARHLGIAKQSVHTWETMKTLPSADKLVELADYFDVPLDYLTGRGIFHNWEQIMENKDRLFDFLENDVIPELKEFHLRDASEKQLMHVLPAFIDHVHFAENGKMQVFLFADKH